MYGSSVSKDSEFPRCAISCAKGVEIMDQTWKKRCRGWDTKGNDWTASVWTLRFRNLKFRSGVSFLCLVVLLTTSITGVECADILYLRTLSCNTAVFWTIDGWQSMFHPLLYSVSHKRIPRLEIQLQIQLISWTVLHLQALTQCSMAAKVSSGSTTTKSSRTLRRGQNRDDNRAMIGPLQFGHWGFGTWSFVLVLVFLV